MDLPTLTRTEKVSAGLYLFHFDNGGVVEADKHGRVWRVTAFAGPIWMSGPVEWAKSLKAAKRMGAVVASIIR